MNRRIASAGLLLALTAATAASSMAQAPVPPGATVTELARTSTTVAGQPLTAPQGAFEMVISSSELPVGGSLPMHKHPWHRYSYVERGRLQVRYEQSGVERVVGPGEVLIEAVDQWHEARVIGDVPVRVIVIDQVPPGQSNVVRR